LITPKTIQVILIVTSCWPLCVYRAVLWCNCCTDWRTW